MMTSAAPASFARISCKSTGSALILAGLSLIAGCDEHKPMQNVPTARSEDWQQLSQLRIAFGHQSVGYNLIAGIETLAREQSRPVAIAETHEAFTGPGIHHFKIGRNEAPQTKLADFDAIMRSGVAQSSDIAMMKLCFIDFGPQTRPLPLARAYIAELQRLSAEYPRTLFIPITAPLTTVQTGPRAWLKRLMGSEPEGYGSNARRHAFNQALREHYGNKNILFDIASIESGFGRSNVDYGGEHVETLDPALTTDGGHLNAQGQRLIGGALVHHLATASVRPQWSAH